MAYFDVLAPDEQLEAYREIRDRVAAAPKPPAATKAAERANTRLEALDAFRRVSEHLGLEEGKAPTPKQFDDGCKALGLSWNRSKVVRTFKSWRRGRDTFLGRPVSLSPEERRRRRRTADGKREGLVSGVKLFLDSNPKATTMAAYDDWRESYNETLPRGRLPVTKATHIVADLDRSWKHIIAVARGGKTLEEGENLKELQKKRGKSYCRGPYEFYALGDLIDVLRKSRKEVIRLANRRSFPRAVIQLPYGRLWLKDEVDQYKLGKFSPNEGMKESALRNRYLTREEVMEREKLTDWQIRHGTADRELLEPEVYLGRVSLWLVETVEAWEERNRLSGGAKRRAT
ncbi:MAG: hypothetical protein ABSC51_01105 [Gaiellaceae bacterium]|jgi:hypothetical protein